MGLTTNFKVKLCQILCDPVDSKRKKYILYVDMDKLPGNIPMQCNPRDQKLTTRVAKCISETVLQDDKAFFHVLNKGITILATNVVYNRQNSVISMDFNDLNVHGNIDGGHTYAIINRDKHKTNKLQYVQVEVLEGYDDLFAEIAAARNTSVQVTQSSIMELDAKYDLIKEVLRGTELHNKVAYKQNENKPVLIEDVISLLYMFDISRFTTASVNQPCISAANKSMPVEYFSNRIDKDNNAFVKLIPILPTIIRLCNYVELNMPKAYDSLTPGKSYFGRTAGITSVKVLKVKRYAMFAPSESVDYFIPKGLLYPIVAALRCLLVIGKNGNYEFNMGYSDLLSFIDSILPKLTALTVTRIRNNKRSILEMARDKDHWANLLREVEIACIRKEK